jgi:predicted metal-dependent hydrolase
VRPHPFAAGALAGTIAVVVADRVSEKAAYSVRRSARARRSRLTMTDAGDVIVVLPARAPLEHAEWLVTRHAAWIERHSARIVAGRLALAMRPSLVFGRTLEINGRPEVVRARTDAERVALERRLRRAARAAIVERIAARGTEMGIGYMRITIRDQRTRWGSASSRSGTLSFSWRLILTPPEVLDYVVVHELAHLRVPGHGKRFWDLVELHHPSVSAARQWLRANQDAIRHALDW